MIHHLAMLQYVAMVVSQPGRKEKINLRSMKSHIRAQRKSGKYKKYKKQKKNKIASHFQFETDGLLVKLKSLERGGNQGKYAPQFDSLQFIEFNPSWYQSYGEVGISSSSASYCFVYPQSETIDWLSACWYGATHERR